MTIHTNLKAGMGHSSLNIYILKEKERGRRGRERERERRDQKWQQSRVEDFLSVQVAWMSLDDDVFPLPRKEVCDRVRERRRGEKTGVGKDNPNKHLVDILPSTPKLITVPLRS